MYIFTGLGCFCHPPWVQFGIKSQDKIVTVVSFCWFPVLTTCSLRGGFFCFTSIYLWYKKERWCRKNIYCTIILLTCHQLWKCKLISQKLNYLWQVSFLKYLMFSFWHAEKFGNLGYFLSSHLGTFVSNHKKNICFFH